MRRIALCGLLLALAVALLHAPPSMADGTRLEKSAAKQKTKIAKVWLDLARYLEGRDLKDEAEDAVAKARALDPELRDLDDVASRVEALAGEGEMDASTEKRIAKARSDAAKGYDKLAAVFQKEKNDARYAGYLVEAISLDPSKRRIGKFADLAKKGSFLMRSPTHPLVAFVSFPKSWKAGRECPVLVSVEGAGSNFAGNAKQFQSARGSRGFITISPHALSCTNQINPKKYPAYSQALIDEWNAKRAAFDVPGLLALLDFLRDHFNASPKIAITGFSGGGNLCYGFLLRHPDRVLCAAPACANFNPGLASGAAKVEDGGPPVHILTGEKDPHRYLTHGKSPPGIEEQTDWAEKALADHGFTNVKRTMLDGVGHSSCPRQVWGFVDEVLEGK
jgi:predicted esterase